MPQYTGEMRKRIEGFAAETPQLLQTHSFRGNVRELRNIVERAVILCKGGTVTPEDLHFDPPGGGDPQGQDGIFNLAEIERGVISRALGQCGGNQVQAARLLTQPIAAAATRRQDSVHAAAAFGKPAGSGGAKWYFPNRIT